MDRKWLVIIQGQSKALVILPVQVFRRYAVLFHGNAVGNRTNQLAKVTAHAFLVFNSVGVVRMAFGEVDRLVGCVFTNDITQTAMDAFILVDLGDVVKIDVQVFPMRDIVHGLADKIFQLLKAFLVHPVAESFAHVFNNAEAMFHRGSTHLHIGCAE